MKIKILLFLIVTFTVIGVTITAFQKKMGNEPWTSKQLLDPEDLAKIINEAKSNQLVIFSIGPSAMIKGSNDIGPAKDSGNLIKLKQELKKLPKGATIIIYCGCCPFEHCPNIRPAFSLLNEMKFSNHKLLNLEHNIKIDWINKGYPTIK